LLNPPQFPVIIGVTGHRNIAPGAVDPVRCAVKDLLKTWQCKFGSALHVLTALADGADQLVAEVALECGVPLIAVAPFHQEHYRSTLQCRDKFDVLWCKAILRLVLPDIGTDSATTGADSEANYCERQYEQLGVLLIRRSHLLLGLWDGEWQARKGGTLDVIRMRRWGDHDAAETFQNSPIFLDAKSYLDETNRGPLLRILTPRDDGPVPSDPAGSCRLLGLPDPPKPRHWSSFVPFLRWLTDGVERPETTVGPLEAPAPTANVILDTTIRDLAGHPVEPGKVLQKIFASGMKDFMLINDLNKIMREFSGSHQWQFHEQLGYLNIAGLPNDALPSADILKQLQAGADTAAQKFQALLLGHYVPANNPLQMVEGLRRLWGATRRRGIPGVLWLFALELPLAVLLFEGYASTHARSPSWSLLWILLYSVMVGVTFIFYHAWMVPQAWQEKFQDYRALAEALRVQLYWAIAAVPASVSDHYLRKQSGELGWIQFALRGPSLWATSVAEIIMKPQRGIIENGWVNDQSKFFARKAELNNRAAEGAELYTTIFVILGIIGAIGLGCLFFVKADDDTLLAKLHEDHEGLLLATATLPGVAAFFSVSARLRSYQPHAHAYALMRRMFRRAADLMSICTSDAQFQNIVRELGREALSENAEWLGEHRNRKIEPGS
jgi:hypothetical protein